MGSLTQVIAAEQSADQARAPAVRGDLLDPPCTSEQIEAVTNGRRPTGTL